MFTLRDVVPWGRSFDEYVRMFGLSVEDLGRSILGCGDGPAGFNAEATRRGSRVTSADPLYGYDRDAIRGRIDDTFDDMLKQTRLNADEFVWDRVGSVEELGRLRMSAMEDFLADFDPGRQRGRYVVAGLPALPFDDASFDLALCGHFLFLYSAQLDLPFHLAALRELCRVALEVRVFPLLALGGRPSPFVEPCVAELSAAGFGVTIDRVPYEFQRGGNELMRVRRKPRSAAP